MATRFLLTLKSADLYGQVLGLLKASATPVVAESPKRLALSAIDVSPELQKRVVRMGGSIQEEARFEPDAVPTTR
jgi:hypothetical protein